MNKLEKEKKDKIIKEREKISNIVLNNTLLKNNNNPKDTFQYNQILTEGYMNINENNLLSRDYRKEIAEAKSQNLENIKNKLNIPKSNISGTDQFEAMNNKLIFNGLRANISK